MRSEIKRKSCHQVIVLDESIFPFDDSKLEYISTCVQKVIRAEADNKDNAYKFQLNKRHFSK